jgi:hypothetical protein
MLPVRLGRTMPKIPRGVDLVKRSRPLNALGWLIVGTLGDHPLSSITELFCA